MRGRRSGLSRIVVRDMLSYQSLISAGAGTPSYEKPELWLGTANWHGGFCHAPPRPQRGTSPSPREVRPRYIFSFRPRPSVYNSARFAGGEPASRLIGGHIPDRSPGCAFVRMTIRDCWRFVRVGCLFERIAGTGCDERRRGFVHPANATGSSISADADDLVGGQSHRHVDGRGWRVARRAGRPGRLALQDGAGGDQRRLAYYPVPSRAAIRRLDGQSRVSASSSSRS